MRRLISLAALAALKPGTRDRRTRASSAGFVSTSIADPGASIAPGYRAGVMPSVYAKSPTPGQLADLVAVPTQGH